MYIPTDIQECKVSQRSVHISKVNWCVQMDKTSWTCSTKGKELVEPSGKQFLAFHMNGIDTCFQSFILFVQSEKSLPSLYNELSMPVWQEFLDLQYNCHI